MKIYNTISYNWNDRLGRYILVESSTTEYCGSVALCKGASQQQQQILNSQQGFMKTLQGDFGTAFQGQQNILNSLTSALQPILQAGPSQFGFSAPENAALNTLATSGTAAQTRNAQQAAGEQAASLGGGNSVLPTNAAAQTQAGIAQAGAQQESNQLLGIKQAGYQQGNTNFWNSVGATNSAGQLENPGTYAGSANTAGSDAASNAGQIQQMNNAASPWNVVGGILGGVAQTALGAGMGALTGGMSSALPGLLGGLGSGVLGGMSAGGQDTSGLGMIPEVPVSGFNF